MASDSGDVAMLKSLLHEVRNLSEEQHREIGRLRQVADDRAAALAAAEARAERAERERDERKWMEDGGTWEDRAKAAEARLAEYGACAATPLMADVLAQRDALAEALREVLACAWDHTTNEVWHRARAALAGVTHG